MDKSTKNFNYSDVLEATPEAEFTGESFSVFGPKNIDYLKARALGAPRNRYRICLHKNHSSATQEMLICLAGFSYFHPHRHPSNRSESYHMVEGELDVYLLNEFGEILEKIELAAPSRDLRSQKPFMYRVSDSVYHFTVPRSEITIYHEVLTGPWGADSIEYAKFAPGENQFELARIFTENITGLKPEELIKKN